MTVVSADFLARYQQFPEIVANVPGTFANDSYVSRLPGLVRDVVALNKGLLSADKLARLSQLADDMVADKPIPLPSALPDESRLSPTSAQWEQLLAGKGYTWHNSPWFMGEQYMFHLVLLIAGYYSTKVDPFHPSKLAEIEDTTPWIFLENAVEVSTSSPADGESAAHRHAQLERMIKLSLWGNKADGCYKEVKDTVSGAGASLAEHDEYLLVDHSSRVIDFLERRGASDGPVKIQYINDNSGTELLLDLALADHLLTHKWCEAITFNVKLEPMYVSDATPPDVAEHIAAMQQSTRNSAVQALGRRLDEYIASGQITVTPDVFWNQYSYYWDMPDELRDRLAAEATLVIIKGDLNYRRLLGDRLWPPSTPVEEAFSYFPTPFVSFRTLKSDPVVGIPPDVVASLNAEDPKWRFNGVRGTIQCVLKDA